MRASSDPQHLAHRGEPVRRDDGGRVAAIALLGDGHSLVAALGRLETICSQLVAVAVAAAQIAGIVIWGMKVPLGTATAAGAFGLELVLGCWMRVALQRRRDACLDLIAAGRESLPLAAVAHERSRLSSARHRGHLARAIEQVALAEPIGAQVLTARPAVDSRVVGPLRPQLEELAQRLRREQDLSLARRA